MSGWIVITSIFKPTKAVEKIAHMCREEGWHAVVVGDRKTPKDWRMEGVDFLSLNDQHEQFGALSELIPENHYCRKNLGYLYAISKGATFILETDDDNIPMPSFGKNVSKTVRGREVDFRGWVNIYKYFSDRNIWPRGLPLDEINKPLPPSFSVGPIECPVQQYLADGDPDVDAVYRLAVNEFVDFNPKAPSILLSKGSWAPFNTQNTLFYEEMFPLLYVPCHVSFRMTDIWRSFVAQAALWAHGYKLAFHTSTVRQERNAHNLMKDFHDEIVGYVENKNIAKALWEHVQELGEKKPRNVIQTSLRLWEVMVKGQWVPEKEMNIITSWFEHFPSSS